MHPVYTHNGHKDIVLGTVAVPDGRLQGWVSGSQKGISDETMSETVGNYFLTGEKLSVYNLSMDLCMMLLIIWPIEYINYIHYPCI